MKKTFYKTLLAILALLPSFSQAALSGAYTIGSGPASSTNYATFASAVSDMATGVRADGGPVNGPGVSGAVTFTVAAATYVERISIPAITGASSTNTITFDGVDPFTRILSWTSTTANDYTLQLNGADYIRILNLGVANPGTTYGIGIQMIANADNNIVNGCRIVLPTTGTSTAKLPIIIGTAYTTLGSFGANNSLLNNTVIGGYVGITANAPSTQATGLTITNNVVTDAYFSGMYIQYFNLANITGNTVTMRLGNTSSYGAQLRSCSEFAFSRNKLAQMGTYGLYVLSANFNQNNAATIENNMIGGIFQSTSTIYGLYLSTCRFLNIYHNSVLCDNPTGTGARALYQLGTSNDFDLRNNVFATTCSTSSAYAMYITSTAAVSLCDNNDYHCNGPVLAFVQANYANLAAMQTGWLGTNTSSQQVWPNFISGSDLHTVGTALHNWATNLPSVVVDIDGNTRPLPPDLVKDVGADEYNIPLVDLDVSSILTPVVPVVGSNVVSVELISNGSSSLNGSNITLQYSTDGGTTWPVSQTYVATTLGAPGNTQAFTFSTPWNIATNGSYTLCVRINPQIVGDPDVSDQSCRTFCTGMVGAYTVNSGLPTSGTNFNTFTDLAAALSGCGIAGAVNVTVAPGLYVETFTIGQINGASSTNTVTIDGMDTSLVTLGFNHTTANASVVTLDNADYVTFRRMKITSTGSTYGSCIKYTNQADNNTVDQCVLLMPVVSTSVYHIGVLASGTTYSTAANSANFLTVSNTRIRGGYHGIRMMGVSTTSYCDGNRLLNNSITEHYYYGIYSYYQSNNEFVGNIIVGRTTGVFSTFGYGIYSYYAQGNFKIDKNIIHSNGAYGIYSGYGNANNSGKGSISNNMIGSNFSTTGNAYCLNLLNNRDVDVYHNSMHLGGNGGYCLYATGASPNSDSLRLINNIFHAAGAFPGTGGRAIYINSPNCVQRMNNNLYSGGAQVIYWGGTTYNTLQSFQTGVPAFNSNSLFDDPGFISSTNLHLLCSPVDNLGSPVGVLIDVDGQNRSLTTPDIGADEFTGISVNTSLGPDTSVCGRYYLYADTVNFDTYLWGGGQFTNSLQIDTTGTYSIFVIDSNNCRARDTIFIVVDSLPLLPYRGDTIYDCGIHVLDAQNTGSTYLWSTGDPTQTITPGTTGNYTVTITTPAGCSLTDSVRLDVYANPNLELGPDTSFCFGTGSLINAGSGPVGTQYQWSTGATTQIIVASSPGTYFVTVTSPFGCESYDSVSLNILLAPVVSLGPNRIECGPFALDAQNPGATYQWSTGANSQVINASTSGSYSVTVTNSIGCSSTDVVSITVAIPPAVNLGPNLALCFGQTLTLDAGNGNLQHLWSTGATSQTIPVSVPGTYIVNVTNPSTGCVGSDTIDIIQSFLTVNLGPDLTICPGETVTLDAGAMPTTYQWSTGSTSQTIQVTTPGIYGVTVSDNVGCVLSDQVNVAQGITPVAAFTSSAASIPLFTPSQFTDNSTGATTWSWDFGDGGTSTQQNPTYTFLAMGSFNVCLTASNGTCTNTICQTITVGPPVDVEDGDLASGLVLYPNPTDGQFSLDFDLAKSLDLVIDVFSMSGQSVAHRDRKAVRLHQESFDLTDLARGMYFVKVQSTKGGVWVRKIVIQ